MGKSWMKRPDNICETPSNPAAELIDLEFLGKLKEKYKLILNVDNCFTYS
jgi:cystathionine beta-lyase/cystathionine gamma-synthase